MELKGQQTLSLPIDTVWKALNDPAILRQCIPGCDSFEPTQENQYKIVMTATVGPIRAKFTGRLALSDIRPPVSYTLKFDGSGAAAGSGKGNADVHLSETPEGTLLQYTVGATVTGRLAQVGARLIDGVAKKMADQFFAQFKSILEPEAEAAAGPSTTTAARVSATERSHGAGRHDAGKRGARGQGMKWATAAAIALAIILGLYAFST